MYFRIVRAAGAKGTHHEYVRLVESYRRNGKNKQRTVANLGRKDLLLPHLDSLNRLLRGDSLPSDSGFALMCGRERALWRAFSSGAEVWVSCRKCCMEPEPPRRSGRGGQCAGCRRS